MLQTDRNSAVSMYVQALKSDPDHGGAWNNLGSLIQARYGRLHSELMEVMLDAYFVLINGDNNSSHHNVISHTNANFKQMLSLWLNNEHVPFFITHESELRSVFAEICYRKAIYLHPNTHATAYNNLGKLLHVQGHSYLFISSFQYPQLYGTGDTQEVELFDNEAVRSYRKAISISSTYSNAWFNLGLLLQSSSQDISLKLDKHYEVGDNKLSYSTSYLSSFSKTDNTLSFQYSQAMISFEKAMSSSSNTSEVFMDSCRKLADLYLKAKIIINEETDAKLMEFYNFHNESNQLSEQSVEGFHAMRKKLLICLKLDLLSQSSFLFKKLNNKANVSMVQFIERQISQLKKKL